MTENNKDEFIEITRIKEEFIANASHELKTPIASVRLAAESALTSLERDDGMTKTFLEQILRDSDRMNELISDLLDLSAMESSDVFMESFDLHEVIANEVSYLSKQNKKRIGYKKKKVEIYANFDDISLAVKNLIKNALKYSPPEENILIQVDENDKSVKCSFQDFGSGISKSDQEKLNIVPSDVLPYILEENFFSDVLKLETFEINDFLFNLDSDEKMKNLILEKNQFLVIDYLLNKADSYKNLKVE